MPKYTVEVASDHVCDLGEGPHWDEKSQTLYYVDLLGGDICCLDIKTQKSQKIHIGSVTTAVIPYDSDKPEFLITQANRILKLTWNTKQTQLLAQTTPGNRFNGGKCDSSGRFWIGTMDYGVDLTDVDPDKGSLYLVDSFCGMLNVEEKAENITQSNGIAWSLDYTKMYSIDSIKRLIYVYDYDVNAGDIANQRVFVDLNGNKDFESQELPYGMTVDNNGNLWVACFRGSRVANIDSKTGRVIDSVKLPTSLITSVCFGGPQRNQLFVTSGIKPLNEQQRQQQPKAGYIFKVTSDSSSFGGPSAHYRFSG